MAIIHDNDGQPISRSNALSVSGGRYSTSFQATARTSNALRGNGGLTARSATSGQSIYATDLVISVSSAMNVQVEDSDGTVLMEEMYLSANSTTPIRLATSIKVASGKALKLIASIAAPISVFVAGYEE